MSLRFKSPRQQDVNLAEAYYVLDGQGCSTRGRSERSEYNRRNQMCVYNVTDEALTIVVLPLSHPDSTVGEVRARLGTSDRKQIQWALDEAIRHSSKDMVHEIVSRSDFVQNDSASTTLSEVLLIVAKVDGGNKARVLYAQRVLPSTDWVLAVLPGMLEEGSIPFSFQSESFMECAVSKVLSSMEKT